MSLVRAFMRDAERFYIRGVRGGIILALALCIIAAFILRQAPILGPGAYGIAALIGVDVGMALWWSYDSLQHLRRHRREYMSVPETGHREGW